jgi:hypothetical protein
MLFHIVHVETRGRHVDCTSSCFSRAVPRHEFFSVVPVLTWGATWTPLENDVDCKFFDVSFIVADVGLALRGDVWSTGMSFVTCICHMGHLAGHVYDMWDILLDMYVSCGTSCATKIVTKFNFWATHYFVRRPL